MGLLFHDKKRINDGDVYKQKRAQTRTNCVLAFKIIVRL